MKGNVRYGRIVEYGEKRQMRSSNMNFIFKTCMTLADEGCNIDTSLFNTMLSTIVVLQ